MGNFSANGRRMALVRASSQQPAEVFVADVSAKTWRCHQRTHLNKALMAQLQLSQPEMYWVDSNGTPVQVWVMTPPKGRRRRGPAVLQVHGGPHCQYGVGFFHEMQLLAAAGYTVVFSNPRGSKGYGRDFCASIKGAWGGADWEDIQAVTAFMGTLPTVDPKRIGIMGGSYGGYMTNWAVSHSDRYRAAITDRSICNLVNFFGSTDLPGCPGHYWSGNNWDSTDTLWAQSPLQFFGNVQAPMLIIHSEGDLRCPIDQADQIFFVLKMRKIPVRLVRYPASTSHGMSRSGPPKLRIHRLHQILDWWKKYL